MLEASLVASILLVVAAPAAPEDPAARFDERVEVTEILLDVVAFDRDGEPVPDLGVDDFVVREDGEPVELTGVSFYTTWYDPAGRGPDAGHASEIPSSRYFVLFFHDVRFQRAQPMSALPRMVRYQREAGRHSHDWVLEDLQPSDWVAVVGWGKRGLGLYQDFTQDRAALADAAMAAGLGQPPPVLSPSERARPPRSGEPALRRVIGEVEQLERATERVEDALRLVAEASGHVVGRKNLLFFTAGLGGSATAGRDAGPYAELEQVLNDNNVALYAVDLGGPSERGREALLADRSGGAFLPGVRFGPTLRQVSRENRGYYVLSYRTEVPAGERGYRNVEVEARDKTIEVRARQGFRFGS